MDEKQGKKEHIRLASVVKSVHADLRKKLRSRELQDENIKFLTPKTVPNSLLRNLVVSKRLIIIISCFLVKIN